jgi:PKD repeat protein
MLNSVVIKKLSVSLMSNQNDLNLLLKKESNHKPKTTSLMKTKNLLAIPITILFILLQAKIVAQIPVANFTISPNPICSGTTNVVQVTDLSSNAPSSWAYTVQSAGPGPGGSTTLSAQNPTLSFNGQGTYTVTLIATNASGTSAPFTQTLLVLGSPNAFINNNTLSTCVGGNPITIVVQTGGGPGGGAGNSYLWSTGASSSSISVTPSVTTSYSCTITGTNGCSVERTATITVGAASVTIASNPVNICPGNASTLTATGTNPGPFTYSWSTSASTRTISTTIAGIYDVTVTNANGCSAIQSYTLGTSSTLSLTTSSTPSLLCAGSTATVRVTGATSYTWSNGASTANTTLNPTSSATYTVSGQVGACSGTASILITVNVTPTIVISISSPSICQGNSVQLNASGANTYTWLPASIAQSISVSPTVSTTYTVRGNNPGCANRTATVAIGVSPTPVITISSSSSLACAGDVVALAANGAANYTWTGGSTNPVFIITPSTTTSYTVTGASTNNCKNTATFTQSVSACSGIFKQNSENDLISLFPNPNKGSFVIKTQQDAELTIINQTGQIIKTISVKHINTNETFVSDLSPGIYFVVGQTQFGVVKQKIVVLN